MSIEACAQMDEITFILHIVIVPYLSKYPFFSLVFLLKYYILLSSQPFSEERFCGLERGRAGHLFDLVIITARNLKEPANI